jgi:hypothetical protein
MATSGYRAMIASTSFMTVFLFHAERGTDVGFNPAFA